MSGNSKIGPGTSSLKKKKKEMSQKLQEISEFNISNRKELNRILFSSNEQKLRVSYYDHPLSVVNCQQLV